MRPSASPPRATVTPCSFPRLRVISKAISIPRMIFPYAPPAGRPGLRERWREKLLDGEPVPGEGKAFGLPIVTSAITHGLALAGELFLDPGDLHPPARQALGQLPAGLTRCGSVPRSRPTRSSRGGGFNTDGLPRTLWRPHAPGRREKLLGAAELPQQPDGLHARPRPRARRHRGAGCPGGTPGPGSSCCCDDAYFGLFYPPGRRVHDRVALRPVHWRGRHPNLLAVKLDGATKELFVWGLRCGFLTYGPGSQPTPPRKGVRGARRQDSRRHPRGHLQQPDALPEPGGEGPGLGP